MLDGITDAVELVGDLLDGRSGLNSGNSPAPGPTAPGTLGSGTANVDSGDPAPGDDQPRDLRERWRERRRRRRERRELIRQRRPEMDLDPADMAVNLHDPVLQDNVEEAVDLYHDVTEGGPRRRKRLVDHLGDLFTKRLRPRFPTSPADQLLSEEGAEAGRGLIKVLHHNRVRDEHLLGSGELDWNAFMEDRQAPPLQHHRDRGSDGE